MNDIINGLRQAFELILSMDKEIYGIIALSLVVTVLSTAISSMIALPLGVIMGSREFPAKRTILRLVHTLTGLPPVVAGLLVYLFLSSKGPLGSFELLFSPAAMVIAQVLIVTPIITALTIAAIKYKCTPVKETCTGLGIGITRTMLILLHESRYAIFSAILAGYGRAISEVGAVMLVGGNIQYNTRVMTTAIVLETGKGNYDRALALGMILLIISFLINWILQRFQEGK